MIELGRRNHWKVKRRIARQWPFAGDDERARLFNAKARQVRRGEFCRWRRRSRELAGGESEWNRLVADARAALRMPSATEKAELVAFARGETPAAAPHVIVDRSWRGSVAARRRAIWFVATRHFPRSHARVMVAGDAIDFWLLTRRTP